MARINDEDYTTPPASDASEESLSDASWSDVSDDDDFLDGSDVEASELEEGEEVVTKKPKPRSKPTPVKNGGGASQLSGQNDIVGRRLKPPTVIQMSCKMLFDQIESGEIDLEAEYQRAVVWPERNQSKLIDSVLRNYYIPPVVFSKQERNLEEVKVCVDGKQRLTSIWKFMSGEIPYIHKKTNDKYYWKKPPSRSKQAKILPDVWKAEFSRAQITTVSFTGLAASEERDIFARVQLGMALTTPEKWQALQGPWPDFLRELRMSYFNEDRPETNILGYISWDASRAKDFQDLVRMAFMVNSTVIKHESTPPVSTDKLELALMDEDGPSDKFKIQMTTILATFLRLVREPKYKYAFAGKVAPVELVMIAVLIGSCMDIVKDADLADGIRDMRNDVRANTAKGYIMWKPETVRKMLGFIGRWKARRKKLVVASGTASQKSRASLSSTNSLPKKRRIPDESSEEEPLQDRNVRQRETEDFYRIPKKADEPPKPPKIDSRQSSTSTIGNSKVPTPQRLAPPPLISRETLLSQSSARPTPSYAMSRPVSAPLKKEERSPVDYKPPTSMVPTNSVRPVTADATDGMDLQQKIDYVTREINTLQELVARGDRPDHAELMAKLQERGSYKSQLLRDKFLNNAYKKAASRPGG